MLATPARLLEAAGWKSVVTGAVDVHSDPPGAQTPANACPIATSPVHMLEESPYVVSLAILRASSASPNGKTVRTGPKISSARRRNIFSCVNQHGWFQEITGFADPVTANCDFGSGRAPGFYVVAYAVKLATRNPVGRYRLLGRSSSRPASSSRWRTLPE